MLFGSCTFHSAIWAENLQFNPRLPSFTPSPSQSPEPLNHTFWNFLCPDIPLVESLNPDSPISILPLKASFLKYVSAWWFPVHLRFYDSRWQTCLLYSSHKETLLDAWMRQIIASVPLHTTHPQSGISVGIPPTICLVNYFLPVNGLLCEDHYFSTPELSLGTSLSLFTTMNWNFLWTF